MGKIKEGLAGILYPPGTTRLELRVSCALVLILFSTQLTLTTPFPYLPSMVKSFGFKDADTGYYAGIIASSLFAGRFIGGYFWGYMTDKLGRRPVLLMSATLTYLATLMFGFSTNIYFAVAARFMQGLCNGVIVCGRAAFAEICDETNQAIGVSLIFAAWNAAIVLGPAMGGFLANPVQKYPKVFGKGVLGKIFTKFRYLLPSIVITSLLLISIIATYCFFEETQETKKKHPEKAKDRKEELEMSYHEVKDDTPLLQDEDEYEVKEEKRKKIHDTPSNSEAEMSDREDEEKRTRHESYFLCCGMVMRKIRKTSLYSLMSDPTVTICVGLFGLSGFVIIGFQELTALWMASNIKHGGLAFTTDKIAMTLLWPALVSAIIQPIIFGRVERRLGGILTLQICLIVLSFTTLGFSFLNEIQANRPALWSLLVTLRFFRMLSDISVRSALAMFVNNSVFSDQAGVVNGYAFSIQEIMRAFSPSLLGALFAWSVKYGLHKIGFPMDHHIAFFVLTVLIILEFAGTFLLPKSINRPKKRTTTRTLKEAAFSDSN